MKVLIVSNSNLYSGGANQYEKLVSNLFKINNDKYEFFYLSSENNNKNNMIYYKKNIIDKVLNILNRNIFIYKIFQRIFKTTSRFEKILNKNKINIIYFLSPNTLAFELSNIPFITTVWDLEHRNFNYFPELNYNNEIEKRDITYNKILQKSFKIIVESEITKKNIVEYYLVNKNKISVLPFFIDENDFNDLSYQSKYVNLNNTNYILYPAQFWSHKNHIYLIEVMKLFKNHNSKLKLILTGTDKGNLFFIKKQINLYGLENIIKILGFVDRKDLIYLYKNCLALVMPTLIGPTNIPPLEAFASNTLVCHSDLEFARAQLKDAAIYFDINKPSTLFEILNDIINNSLKYEKYKLNGKKIIKNWKGSDFYNKMILIFDEYEFFRKTWSK